MYFFFTFNLFTSVKFQPVLQIAGRRRGGGGGVNGGRDRRASRAGVLVLLLLVLLFVVGVGGVAQHHPDLAAPAAVLVLFSLNLHLVVIIDFFFLFFFFFDGVLFGQLLLRCFRLDHKKNLFLVLYVCTICLYYIVFIACLFVFTSKLPPSVWMRMLCTLMLPDSTRSESVGGRWQERQAVKVLSTSEEEEEEEEDTDTYNKANSLFSQSSNCYM